MGYSTQGHGQCAQFTTMNTRSIKTRYLQDGYNLAFFASQTAYLREGVLVVLGGQMGSVRRQKAAPVEGWQTSAVRSTASENPSLPSLST